MEKAEVHFTKRAKKYNHSSNWVEDQNLIHKIFELSEVNESSMVLDIATGTGLIANEFFGKVKKVIGLDVSRDMVKYANDSMDEIVFSPIEKTPFKENTFDACVCRQGLQFAELNKAIPEIHRVLKPGGVTVLCHLTAYNEMDKDLTFQIQELRNPARRNYFMPNDISELLIKNGFSNVENIEYITDESVNKWIDNGAIAQIRMKKIKSLYKSSNEIFKKIHNIRFTGNDILDAMMLVIVKAKKGF